jgi:hypothetical protein
MDERRVLPLHKNNMRNGLGLGLLKKKYVIFHEKCKVFLTIREESSREETFPVNEMTIGIQEVSIIIHNKLLRMRISREWDRMGRL